MSTNYWAKKPWGQTPPPTVVEHCRQVAEAAEAIWNAIGQELAAALGIDPTALHDELYGLLRCAALLHDYAKVNSAFQQMLTARPQDVMRQPVRHEILAAWLLSDPDFLGGWFSGLRAPNETWPIIWAIAGHHLKMSDPARPPADARQPKNELFSLRFAPKTVNIPLSSCTELFREAANALRPAADVPPLCNPSFNTANDDDDSLQERITRFANTSFREWRKRGRDSIVQRRTALLKAVLIAADVAASALIADSKRPSEWVNDALGHRITAAELDKVVIQGTKGKRPLPFQENVGQSASRATIVIAGCGNGKTTAAYLWAQKWGVGKKLWFTYPTTGTASAGYEGYLFDHPDLITALIHGRAEVDIKAMRGSPGDDHIEETLRLESLRAWGCQAIMCTVDTVLGLLQAQRRPLFSFPSLAVGAFVFDEIHSYDARLFGGLLRFLQTFPNVPVLLMSASIPPGRLEELKRFLGDRAGDVIPGDPKLEKFKRYRLEPRDSAEACRNEVQTALRSDKNVLWICNTVADAVQRAREAREWSAINPSKIIIYHSRFRYGDRVQRQKDLITKFRATGPVLAITTQICEMSLDISANLMVTAECPLPSLVQRLGRLNRYAEKDDPWGCLVFPFEGLPYNEDETRLQLYGDCRVEMAATRAAVRELAGQPCSQRELATRLDKMVGNEDFELYSAWLDDGWLTEPASVRDGDNSITVIREEDLPEIEKQLGKEHAKPSRWTNRSLVPWTIPMQCRRAVQIDRRAGGYPVAPTGSIRYSTEEGAEWQTNMS